MRGMTQFPCQQHKGSTQGSTPRRHDLNSKAMQVLPPLRLLMCAVPHLTSNLLLDSVTPCFIVSARTLICSLRIRIISDATLFDHKFLMSMPSSNMSAG